VSEVQLRACTSDTCLTPLWHANSTDSHGGATFTTCTTDMPWCRTSRTGRAPAAASHADLHVELRKRRRDQLRVAGQQRIEFLTIAEELRVREHLHLHLRGRRSLRDAVGGASPATDHHQVQPRRVALSFSQGV